MGDSSNIHMGGAEFLFKFSTKVFPVNESVRLWVFFLPLEYSGSPFFHSFHFYVGQSPNNFGLVIREVVWAQSDVGLEEAEEGGAAGMISIKLRGQSWWGAMSGWFRMWRIGTRIRCDNQFFGIMGVIRVSSLCWVFTFRACNLEGACSRDARHSFFMARKGAVLSNCFPKLSEEESSAGKYMECIHGVQ
jgi:hypothetical protein